MANAARHPYPHDRADGHILAYRNHLIACWFARVARMPAEQVETYAREIARADRSAPGHGDVIAKLRRDLLHRAIDVPEGEIDTAVTAATARAWQHHGMTD